MYRDERPRGVIVKVMDLSALEAEALEYRKTGHPEAKEDCYEAKIYGGKIAVATDSQGRLYSICTEGVGYEVTDEEPLELQYHGSYHARDENGEIKTNSHTFDMFPFATSTLTPEELLSYPVLEEVDLADHVRTFGSRLEGNFWLWFNTLTK